MSEILYRCASGLELRSDGDGRTVEGIAVPDGVPQRIDDDLTEMFVMGAFADQLAVAHRAARPGGRPSYRVQLAVGQHEKLGGSVAGQAVEIRETDGGLYTALRVSKTAKGDEALELIRDGIWDQLSVGFRVRPGWSRTRSDGVVVRERAQLFEVAALREGAYGSAAVVTGIRSAEQEAEEQERARADALALDLVLL